MPAFRYKHGDRPLDGYTIQHGAGRGGFGEVYYAVSDSGREVALKVIQGYEQIELRGVSQCMNLKSPHLVTIFDVKYNDEGLPFVIMEYVAGPSLRQILDESPSGLGVQKSAFFLREMAKGLSFLHECGIVHRDLKPGNIFYENGYVKIGDYGLSKAISADHRSGQTVTVGTVHYMAPEIGAGRYDRSIDIYALGAVLFELLTGQVPYLGGSAGEILMKHMTAEPEVAGIEEPFATVIRRAMARDPEQRYQSVQEMVEAVFGSEHVRQSVSCFSPESLSMVAARVAQRVAVGDGSSGTGSNGPVPTSPFPARDSDIWSRMGSFVDAAGNRIARIGDRLMDAGTRVLPNTGTQRDVALPSPAADRLDPIPHRQRRLLGLMTIFLISIGTGVFAYSGGRGENPVAFAIYVLSTSGGAVAGILLARRKLLGRLACETGTIQHLVVGGVAGVAGVLLSCLLVISAPGSAQAMLARTWLAMFVMLFLTDWNDVMAPDRPQRVGFGRMIPIALLSALAALLLGGGVILAIGIAAAVHLVVQIVVPWDPAAARRSASQRQSALAAHAANVPPVPLSPPAPPPPPSMGAATAPTPVGVSSTGAVSMPPVSRPLFAAVPEPIRWVWFVLSALLLAGGIMLCIACAAVLDRPEEQSMAVGGAIGMFLVSVFALVRGFTRSFRGWWPYLIRPFLLFICLGSILMASLVLAMVSNRTEEQMIAMAFIIFPVALLPFLLLIRVKPRVIGMTRALPQGMPPLPVPVGSPEEAQPGDVAPETPRWSAPPSAPPSVHAIEADSPGWRFRPGALLILPGLLMLLLATGLGLASALDLPGFAASGIANPQMAQALNRDLGPGNWARSARVIGYVLTYVGMFIAAAFLMASRRSLGIRHMLRVPLGIAVLLMGLHLLDAAMFSKLGAAGDWMGLKSRMPQFSIAQVLDTCINNARPELAIGALAVFGAAMLLLLWPHAGNSVAAPMLQKEGA